MIGKAAQVMSGSPAPPSSATIGDRTSRCLSHTFRDPIPPQSPPLDAMYDWYHHPGRASASAALGVLSVSPQWETNLTGVTITPNLAECKKIYIP
ncbi:hypothetical protein PoB_000199800 [Plakobranchus ocellatus]|uniref:Uncharacterized protein n=1 Tax=Plakobranchus ocellatus TaxID=259542 RepID=A0AAV3XZ59_9GAST|nr:hypothetical protein PoB_000199800 [Plakobranchus ocellatus]